MQTYAHPKAQMQIQNNTDQVIKYQVYIYTLKVETSRNKQTNTYLDKTNESKPQGIPKYTLINTYTHMHTLIHKSIKKHPPTQINTRLDSQEQTDKKTDSNTQTNKHK